MKLVYVVAALFVGVSIITVGVTVPLVLYFRKAIKEDQTVPTTTTTQGVVVSNTSTTTTTRTESSTRSSSTTILSTTASGVTSTTSRSTTTRTTTVTSNSAKTSIYSMNLTESDQTIIAFLSVFAEPTYFEAIELSIPITGNYTIRTTGYLDTVGYLYQNFIDLRFLWLNLLASDDESGSGNNFRIDYLLQASQKYVILVTTYYMDTGATSLQLSGPGTVNFTKVIPTNNTNATVVESLTPLLHFNPNSPQFCFDNYYRDGEASCYYFSLIQLNVSVSGRYFLSSKVDLNSYMYLNAYLYQDRFNSSNISQNLLATSEIDYTNGQFKFLYDLYPMTKYILMVAPYFSEDTGSFTISIMGPGTINYIL